MADQAVANPPAGGPQEFASTNDENINDTLHSEPYVVAIIAHGQLGVVGRRANQADAEALAASRRADRPAFAEFRVVKENDPENGLPALLAEVEAAEAAKDEPAKAEPPKATAAPAPAPKGK